MPPWLPVSPWPWCGVCHLWLPVLLWPGCGVATLVTCVTLAWVWRVPPWLAVTPWPGGSVCHLGYLCHLVLGVTCATLVTCVTLARVWRMPPWLPVSPWPGCGVPIRNLSSWQRREWLVDDPSISVEGNHRLSNHFRLFPVPEVPLSRCWPSSEMPGILCFKIVGIPIKACAAQLSFHVFPLTNQYWHH